MDITIILLIVNVFAAVAVIGLTLIQQPKGDMGAAFGGGGSQSMFGSRGSANFLTKSTAWMCFFFFASSLMLAYMYSQSTAEDASVVDQSVIEQVNQASTELPAIAQPATSTESSGDLPQIPVDAATEAVENAAPSQETLLEDLEAAGEAAAETVEEAGSQN